MYSGLRWQEPRGFGRLEEMIAAYERDHDLLAKQLHTLEGGAWYQQAWLIQGTEEILLKDTVGGLLWIALFDVVHHRGQLSTYIRPMGGKVPSIYGPQLTMPVIGTNGEQEACMDDARQEAAPQPKRVT